MSVHNCIRCNTPIDYDDTDWCDVCDMSIFDERMVKPKNKMLTIQNFESSLLNTWCGNWKITDVLSDVYEYDDDLNFTGPPQYSIYFVYGIGNTARFYLERELGDLLKGKYKYKIYLNQQMINSGGFSPYELKDKNSLINSIVYVLDYELKKTK